MQDNNRKIGFIGLGIMGKAMALNLIKAGYELLILRSSKASSELEKVGAQVVDGYSALAGASDVLITMLPDSPDVEEVVYGTNGVLTGIKEGTLFIDMSTIAPAVSIKLSNALAERNVDALDAPVSGGQVGAEAATLSIMVGGSEAAFERALPIFEAMGKNIVHMGGMGAGQTAKACNQLIVGMTIQAVAEAFTLAKKAGVNQAKLREVLLGGFAQSRILDLHGNRIINRSFEPGFRLKLHRKDMNIVLQTGKALAVPLYGASQVAAHMDAAIAAGDGDLDHSALALLLEKLAGITD
ncbi:2-hydroxy-3-oxopropionate reductase [Parapedobacter koreensis]|uniref:2-hydroxy-3-oxopropionate reductase n=1 Tax=Parapedobacter koreensis TaxID=332977 RepID=A0A1H7UJN4_9SPHI|nr:2-hydroxy-3-oxopropionate reductase [Parapedobacter koreensis]SEL97223.1 2-hydroxy-3-oxopropionate reductase [Parapedobacter koreensis]